MKFLLQLELKNSFDNIIPINYQYPLSAAIYKILQKGDAEYAQFLHKEGYGKGYKFFTFSDLRGKFKIFGDRIQILDPNIQLIVSFHLPKATQTFVEGLFRSEEIVIADQRSKSSFRVKSIQSLESPWKNPVQEREFVSLFVKPISALIIGKKKENCQYIFLDPDDDEYINSLIYSWRNKIAVAYNPEIANQAVLMIEIEKYKNPYRSRLITIKSGTDAETKIKGFLNFKLKITAEKRFIDLILNGGLGLYSAQGMGCLEVVEVVGEKIKIVK